MDFDSMGRRTFYREVENGREVALFRFFYDGYLMIQQLHPETPYDIYKEFIWDPTEPVATKPLCFRQNGQTSTFLTHDGNKNVTDVIRVAPYNDSVGHYEYAPFGAVSSQTGSHAASNPYRFSSEFADDMLGLVYYNYRHYEPMMGRWLNRDSLADSINQDEVDYVFTINSPGILFDVQGHYASNLFGVLQGEYCKDAYNKARKRLHTPQERAAWDRYTNHGWRGRDRNIYLKPEDVQSIAMSISAVAEYLGAKREICRLGTDFEYSTSISGNAPAPWELAIGGVSIATRVSCKKGCFSYCLSINDLYDSDIKGLPGLTSRPFGGELATWGVHLTESCLGCDWESFYHVGSYCGK